MCYVDYKDCFLQAVMKLYSLGEEEDEGKKCFEEGRAKQALLGSSTNPAAFSLSFFLSSFSFKQCTSAYIQEMAPTEKIGKRREPREKICMDV